MQIGQLVDFCIAYNRRQEDASKEAERESKKPAKKKMRLATQEEIDAFLG